MLSKKLFRQLETDFDLITAKDHWSILDLGDYLNEEYKIKQNGLLLDNTKVINKVYTSVFPEEKVLNHLLKLKQQNLLLFTHHPMIWDPVITGLPFKNIPKKYLPKLEEQKISFYNLHTPLDKNGDFSTSTSLAKVLKIEPKQEFFNYFGVKVGIIGRTFNKKVSSIAKTLQKVVGHQVRVWKYGKDEIKDSRVGLVAGGGNYPKAIEELASQGVNLYVTGVSSLNENYQPSIDFHEIAKKLKINVLAGTHYSTEKFACIAMTEYFSKLGINSKFIDGQYYLEDLE
jgi:putative NIF3 family GTP cyclohydrolase 1 type 2